jgi:alanine or glycine:cation symporter, AGCS family
MCFITYLNSIVSHKAKNMMVTYTSIGIPLSSYFTNFFIYLIVINNLVLIMHIIIKNINAVIWGGPMLLILLGTHLFFTYRLGFIQKNVFKAIKLSVKPEKQSKDGISSFGVLTTTLAATLGTGNIVGVSTAIALGGPGAIFWCWLTGILGMATSYAECYLSVLFRNKNENGQYTGGPMYVLEKGLNKKKTACFYAFCTLLASFGVGCTTQSNSITDATSALWHLSPGLVGFVVAIITGLVIVGGIHSIGKVCTKLVPSMGAFYILGCLLLLILNHNYIIASFRLIIESAFLPKSIAGGFIGSNIKSSARYGIARGLFTNEAGIGSAGIAAAGSNTTNPKRQALISMTATFWDTVIMCAITGLVIVSNILKFPSSVIGVSNAGLTTAAFRAIPLVGETALSISLISFAIATLIGWSYFGEKAIEYLLGKKGIKLYQVCYIIMIYFGAIMPLDLVWELTDCINALMAIPNLFALLALQRLVNN